MIDHVSIGVKDIDSSTSFYQPILEIIGLSKLVEKTGTIGFGKRYPEFWLNHRPEKNTDSTDGGCHICLRAKSKEAVDEFYRLAVDCGAYSSGEPGFRTEYHSTYYATFIRDQDSNHIEVVTYIQD